MYINSLLKLGRVCGEEKSPKYFFSDKFLEREEAVRAAYIASNSASVEVRMVLFFAALLFI